MCSSKIVKTVYVVCVCFMFLCAWTHVCVCECVCMSVPEVNTGCLPQGVRHLSSETGSLTEAGAH